MYIIYIYYIYTVYIIYIDINKKKMYIIYLKMKDNIIQGVQSLETVINLIGTDN